MWRPLTPSLGDLMAAGRMDGEWGAAWGPLAEQGPWGVGEAPVLRFGALWLVPLPTGASGGGASQESPGLRTWLGAYRAHLRPRAGGALPASGRGEARTRPQPQSCPSVFPLAGCRQL